MDRNGQICKGWCFALYISCRVASVKCLAEGESSKPIEYSGLLRMWLVMECTPGIMGIFLTYLSVSIEKLVQPLYTSVLFRVYLVCNVIFYCTFVVYSSPFLFTIWHNVYIDEFFSWPSVHYLSSF